MAYDRADWHYGGNFPSNLPTENGGTHIGMFLAWCIVNGLEGDLHKDDSQDSIALVRSRKMTGREFLFKECDEKFWEEDLNETGNAFAKSYYVSNQYITDYEHVLGENVETLYHVQDTWENFDRIKAVIDIKYKKWLSPQTRKWWQFWK
jgi:hypothetical protein